MWRSCHKLFTAAFEALTADRARRLPEEILLLAAFVLTSSWLMRG